MHPPHSHVLQLDVQGTPQAWISLEHAALHVATDSVAWVDGDGPLATLRGGFHVEHGRQSIIALHGAAKVNLFGVVPAFGKGKLLRRDRLTCACCGQRFNERDLQCQHIVPESRGGGWTWMNLVTACAGCNGRQPARLHTGRSGPAADVPALCAEPTRGLSARAAAHPGRRARVACGEAAEGLAPELRA